MEKQVAKVVKNKRTLETLPGREGELILLDHDTKISVWRSDGEQWFRRPTVDLRDLNRITGKKMHVIDWVLKQHFKVRNGVIPDSSVRRVINKIDGVLKQRV